MWRHYGCPWTQNYPHTANGNDPAGVHAVRVKVVVFVNVVNVDVDVDV